MIVPNVALLVVATVAFGAAVVVTGTVAAVVAGWEATVGLSSLPQAAMVTAKPAAATSTSRPRLTLVFRYSRCVVMCSPLSRFPLTTAAGARRIAAIQIG